MGPISPAQIGAYVVNLLDVGLESDFVDAEILRPIVAIAANVNEDRAAPDVFADDLFQFRFEHRIGLGTVDGDLEMAIVDRAHFHAQSEFLALDAGFAEIRSC